MIIIRINDINFGKGNKAFYSYSRNILDQNLLSFDTFSKFEITPPQYFNGDPHFFLPEIKTIPIQISFINFFKKFTNSFFKSNLSWKSSVFPYIFHTKRLYWTHILRSPPFHNNHGDVWAFSS